MKKIFCTPCANQLPISLTTSSGEPNENAQNSDEQVEWFDLIGHMTVLTLRCSSTHLEVSSTKLLNLAKFMCFELKISKKMMSR